MRRRFMCERCGGTGIQEAGLWTGYSYDSVAGICDACDGEGLLGYVPEKSFKERIKDVITSLARFFHWRKF